MRMSYRVASFSLSADQSASSVVKLKYAKPKAWFIAKSLRFPVPGLDFLIDGRLGCLNFAFIDLKI